MKKIIVIFVSLLVSILANSCSILDTKEIYNEVSKHVEIKWNLKANGKPVDSMAIAFDPVYFKLPKYSGRTEKEYEYIKDGYRIWILETADTFRIEVDRVDTLGYIYKR